MDVASATAISWPKRLKSHKIRKASAITSMSTSVWHFVDLDRYQPGPALPLRGLVQGVGFRPFVHGLATQLELAGFVRNRAADGVLVDVEGDVVRVDYRT
jgi:hypothetical protein